MGQLVDDVQNILTDNASAKETKSERSAILKQMAADKQSKTNLIKKVLATQRANYGAGGMSGKGMTEEAVLKRLRDEQAQPFDEKATTNLQKLSKLKTTKKFNLLKSLATTFTKLMA